MFKFDVSRIGPLAMPWTRRSDEQASFDAQLAGTDGSQPNQPQAPAPPSVEWASLVPPTGRTPKTRSFIGWQSETERHDVTRCILDGVRSGSAMPLEIYLRYSSALAIRDQAVSRRPPMDR